MGVSVAGDGSRLRPNVSRVDARQDAHGRQGCQVETLNGWNIITVMITRLPGSAGKSYS